MVRSDSSRTPDELWRDGAIAALEPWLDEETFSLGEHSAYGLELASTHETFLLAPPTATLPPLGDQRVILVPEPVVATSRFTVAPMRDQQWLFSCDDPSDGLVDFEGLGTVTVSSDGRASGSFSAVLIAGDGPGPQQDLRQAMAVGVPVIAAGTQRGCSPIRDARGHRACHRR